jgi:hypothetical protein
MATIRGRVSRVKMPPCHAAKVGYCLTITCIYPNRIGSKLVVTGRNNQRSTDIIPTFKPWDFPSNQALPGAELEYTMTCSHFDVARSGTGYQERDSGAMSIM